jgi:hypothetical protein
MPNVTLTFKTEPRVLCEVLPGASIEFSMLEEQLSDDAKAAGTAAKKKPQFKGVAYSGGAVPRRMYDGSAMLIDVESFQLPADGKEIFMLADHDHARKVGKAMAYKRNGKIVIENGTFFDNEHGKEAALLMEQGAPYEFSVGVNGDVNFIEGKARKKMMVNGITHEIGAEMYNGRLLETSFVTSGADPATVVSRLSADLHIKPVGEAMPGQNDGGDTSGAAEAKRLLDENTRLSADLTAAQIKARGDAERVTALEAELATAKDAFSKLQATVRGEKLSATFGDKITEAERVQFLALPDAAFDVVLSKFAAEAPKNVLKDGRLYQREELDASRTENRAPVSILKAAALRNGTIRASKGA